MHWCRGLKARSDGEKEAFSLVSPDHVRPFFTGGRAQQRVKVPRSVSPRTLDSTHHRRSSQHRRHRRCRCCSLPLVALIELFSRRHSSLARCLYGVVPSVFSGETVRKLDDRAIREHGSWRRRYRHRTLLEQRVSRGREE